jgi:catechol 2,3-dioxygenase-like lactoylglutathione lyase family enzyme
LTPAVRSPEVILFSEDLERAAEFYESLGFKESFRTPDVGEPIHVDLTLDGYELGIASVASTREDHGLDPSRAASEQPSSCGPTTPRRRTKS